MTDYQDLIRRNSRVTLSTRRALAMRDPGWKGCDMLVVPANYHSGGQFMEAIDAELHPVDYRITMYSIQAENEHWSGKSSEAKYRPLYSVIIDDLIPYDRVIFFDYYGL